MVAVAVRRGMAMEVAVLAVLEVLEVVGMEVAVLGMEVEEVVEVE